MTFADLKAASKIIFSNGDLDPWARGGVSAGNRSSPITGHNRTGRHTILLTGVYLVAGPEEP